MPLNSNQPFSINIGQSLTPYFGKMNADYRNSPHVLHFCTFLQKYGHYFAFLFNFMEHLQKICEMPPKSKC